MHVVVPKLSFGVVMKLPCWFQVVASCKLKLVSISVAFFQSRSSKMLKKLMLCAVACSIVFVFGSNDASARVKGCSPCQPVKVHKVRCPKPKCVRPQCCSAPAASCSSCSSGCGQVSETHLAPVADHGPMPSTAAPAETAPAPVEAAPAPSAADALK